MSGVIAIKGFDYQSTVILDRLFDHFDLHGDAARVRPEGKDDLDLTWTDSAGLSHSHYTQVKKPREDKDGNRQPSAWSIQEVIDEFLPNTLRHLSLDTSRQIWILGDEVASDVQSLVDAGLSDALSNSQSVIVKGRTIAAHI